MIGEKLPIERHLGAIESAIEHIAYIRRMAETDGHDMELFDAEVNKLCDKYARKFEAMNELQLALHGVAEVLKSNRAEEFIRDIGQIFKE